MNTDVIDRFDVVWLEDILQRFSCETGTLHRADEAQELLHLVTQIGVPAVLLDKIRAIPFGKGIAGAAAAQREPVQLCNLQQDLGGIAKPDSRKTGVSGSLAVPIVSRDGDRVLGTLGIGMREPHDFGGEETQSLLAIAAEVAAAWEKP